MNGIGAQIRAWKDQSSLYSSPSETTARRLLSTNQEAGPYWMGSAGTLAFDFAVFRTVRNQFVVEAAQSDILLEQTELGQLACEECKLQGC